MALAESGFLAEGVNKFALLGGGKGREVLDGGDDLLQKASVQKMCPTKIVADLGKEAVGQVLCEVEEFGAFVQWNDLPSMAGVLTGDVSVAVVVRKSKRVPCEVAQGDSRMGATGTP